MRQAMREDGVVQLSWSQAEEFLAEVEKRRGHRETVGVYRRNLRHFFSSSSLTVSSIAAPSPAGAMHCSRKATSPAPSICACLL